MTGFVTKELIMVELKFLSRGVPLGCVLRERGMQGRHACLSRPSVASARPRCEMRSSATGIATVSSSPAAVFASEYVAQTHPLPASHPSRGDSLPRPCPVPAQDCCSGQKAEWSAACPLRPVTLLVSLHWQQGSRRAQARERPSLLPARGRAWALVSETPETF